MSYSSSFRGRGSSFGAQRGGFSGRGGRGGSSQSFGPPDTVLEMGTFVHSCEGDIVCQSTNQKIPYFNAPIYLENKSIVGKVDEILGPVNQVFFTIKPQEGIVASSFSEGDKFFIGGDKLLPLERFLPKPKAPAGAKRGGSARGGRGGAVRGGRGGSRGRGAPRGRGGFGSRGRGAPRGGGFSSRGRGGFRGRGN